jgi:hypothetical protein
MPATVASRHQLNGLVKEFDRGKPLARYFKVKDVEAIVVSDDIVKLFWLDTTGYVDFLIEQAVCTENLIRFD